MDPAARRGRVGRYSGGTGAHPQHAALPRARRPPAGSASARRRKREGGHVFQPRVQHAPHLPRSLTPFALSILGVVAGLLAWGLVETRPLGREISVSVTPADPAAYRSVVYTVPDGLVDQLY